MSGGTGLTQAIGGYWARGGEGLEVGRGGRGLSNEVVAQTEDSGLLWAVVVLMGEGRGQTVVTRAGVMAVTIGRVARIEAGHRSRKGVRRKLMVLG